MYRSLYIFRVPRQQSRHLGSHLRASVALLATTVLLSPGWAAAVDPAALIPRQEGFYLEVDLGEDNARVDFLRGLVERVLDAALEEMSEEEAAAAGAQADHVRQQMDWIVDGFGPKAAVLMMPMSMLEQARKEAELAACTSHLRQLAVAARMYADDWDGVLPKADTWVQDLEPYVKDPDVFRCAEAPDLPVGYAMNRALSGRRIADIDDPTATVTVLFFESDLGGDNPAGGVEDIAPPRHRGGNNFAFLDGHAELRRPPQDFPLLGRWEAPPPEDGDPVVIEGPAPDGDEIQVVRNAFAPDFIAVINTRYGPEEILARVGMPAEAAETYRGAALYRPVPPIALAASQGCLLVGDVANVKAALDVAAGEGEALAGDPAFERAVALLPEPRIITFYEPMHLAADLLTIDMGGAPEGMGPPKELREVVEVILAKYEPIEGVAIGVDFTADGLVMNEVVTIKPGATSDFLDRIARIPPATERGAALLPQGTLLLLTMGGFGDAVRLWLDIAQEVGPEIEAEIAPIKEMVKEMAGLDVDTQLLPVLAGDLSIAITGLGGKPLPVQGVVMIQGPDADTLRQRVATVRESLAAKKMKFLDGEAMGRKYSALMIPGTPLAIAFAQVDDMLIVATSVDALEACLSPEAAPAAGLHVAEPYRTQRAALPKTVISVSYIDLGSAAEQGLPMLKAMGAPIPDLEVDWQGLGTLIGADYRQDGIWRSAARWDLNPDIIVALAAKAAGPAFEQAREHMASFACRANLTKLATAALKCADDHDGVLPRADTWVQELQPYLESAEVLKCPQAPGLVIGYAMNRALSGDRLADIRDPANTPLFFESELRGPSPAGRLADIAPPRHRGGSHFAFADGHVALVAPPTEFPTMGEWEAIPPLEEGDFPEAR